MEKPNIRPAVVQPDVEVVLRVLLPYLAVQHLNKPPVPAQKSTPLLVVQILQLASGQGHFAGGGGTPTSNATIASLTFCSCS